MSPRPPRSKGPPRPDPGPDGSTRPPRFLRPGEALVPPPTPAPEPEIAMTEPLEMTRDAKRLGELMRAGHPAILIQTIDESEARQAAFAAADETLAQVWTWSTLDGLRTRTNHSGGPIPDSEPAAGALFWLSQQRLPSVQVFFDLSEHLADPKALRALRRLIQNNAETGGHLILIDHDLPRARVVLETCTPFRLTLPSDGEIEREVRAALQAQHAVRPIEVDLTKGQFRVFLKNLRGLSRRHIRQIVREVVGDKRFDSEDLNHALAIKREMLSDGGVLEFVESPATLDSIGGLDNLKRWLAQRSESFDERAEKYGIQPPRGVLLLGVQGAGKSLSAKAVATGWNRPLLRLDPSALYDKFVGESERRLRDALRQAEAMAPIVLWIDEIEKGFASAASRSTDGGLSQRMFGTLLTWMQDHTEPVFLIATANNIEALPPELLRKGRFDEIFFVDLPGAGARRVIFEIHLKKRDRDPARFDLDALTEAADGFSGAEIEQAVIAGLHAAFSEKRELTTADVLEAVRTSPPLSVTMAEKVAELREWARERCVSAG